MTALADDMEALVTDVEAVLAATAVCEAVLSHRDTDAALAGRIWLLARWVAAPLSARLGVAA